MQASEVIEQLQKLVKEHGDAPVYFTEGDGFTQVMSVSGGWVRDTNNQDYCHWLQGPFITVELKSCRKLREP